MITAKLYGILQLNSGISTMHVDADRVGGVIKKIAATGMIAEKELKNCIILVNGKRTKMQTKLCEGDEIVFLSPAGGG